MPDATRHVLIFGAGGRLGGPVARRLRWLAPDVRLRLATSRADMVAPLQGQFPGAEVVQADLLDPASMERCFAGVDSAFLVTPNFLDEERAMANLAAAADGGFRQLFRVVGDQPGMTPARVPASLRDQPGPAMQHHQARLTLERERVPTCYLNIAGLMSNLFANAPGIVEHDVLAQVPRIHGWIDAGEVGEAAAQLILSNDDRHSGQTYDLDNNHDLLSWAEVTDIFSSVLMRPIAYDPTPEGFLRHVGPIYNRKMGFAEAGAYFVDYFSWEAGNDPAWRRTDTVERLIGRRPKTLRAWIEQNIASFSRAS
jgi:uncharacterized protein YbjT (DUF2867 family)